MDPPGPALNGDLKISPKTPDLLYLAQQVYLDLFLMQDRIDQRT